MAFYRQTRSYLFFIFFSGSAAAVFPISNLHLRWLHIFLYFIFVGFIRRFSDFDYFPPQLKSHLQNDHKNSDRRTFNEREAKRNWVFEIRKRKKCRICLLLWFLIIKWFGFCFFFRWGSRLSENLTGSVVAINLWFRWLSKWIFMCHIFGDFIAIFFYFIFGLNYISPVDDMPS